MQTRHIALTCLCTFFAVAPALRAEDKPAEEKPEVTNAPPAESAFKTDQEKISYTIGFDMGSSLRNQDMALDTPLFERGLREGLAGEKSAVDPAESRKLMMSFNETRMAAQRVKLMKAAQDNKAAADKFLAENKAKEGVVTLASGLQYQILEAGEKDAPKPKKTDPVTVHYTGKLIDGTVFDSSHDRGQPVQFSLNQVIPGWSEGLQQVAVGSKARLFIPPDLGYGERGAPPRIGPNSALIFDVELISINASAPPPITPAPKPAAK